LLNVACVVIAGVAIVGDVPKTRAPVPVSSVTAVIKLALDGVVKNVATPVPNPLIPEDTGSPVQLVNVPELGVPNTGVTNVGDVANTKDPVPVSLVTAVIKLALEGVAKKVATPVPKPLIPEDTGNPVQFVNVPEVGVPNTGVVSVGDVANTSKPVPVSLVTAVIKLALDGVARNVATPAASPLIPEDTGSPVQLVRVPDAGVPIAGATNVLLLRDSVPARVATVPSKSGTVRVLVVPVLIPDTCNARTLVLSALSTMVRPSS